MLYCTCELLLTAISYTGLQVLQLDLHLLIVPHSLFALPPVKHRQYTNSIKVNELSSSAYRQKWHERPTHIPVTALCSLLRTIISQRNRSVFLPVYEHYDEHDESHYGGSHPDSHLSLQRKCRLRLAVVLHSAQREVEIPHFHLENTNYRLFTAWRPF